MPGGQSTDLKRRSMPNPNDSTAEKRVDDQIIEAIKDLIKPDSRVMELSCGAVVRVDEVIALTAAVQYRPPETTDMSAKVYVGSGILWFVITEKEFETLKAMLRAGR